MNIFVDFVKKQKSNYGNEYDLIGLTGFRVAKQLFRMLFFYLEFTKSLTL